MKGNVGSEFHSFTFVIHQEVLCCQISEMENILRRIVLLFNCTHSRALYHGKYPSFVSKFTVDMMNCRITLILAGYPGKSCLNLSLFDTCNYHHFENKNE
jgi:hypothetical protein